MTLDAEDRRQQEGTHQNLKQEADVPVEVQKCELRK